MRYFLDHIGQQDQQLFRVVTMNDHLKGILDQWRTHQRKRLNIFRLVSDIYKRENFHSDIIKTLLEHDSHPDSVRLFIELLVALKPELTLNPNHYLGAKVTREPGRIDILIESLEHNGCVVIENKINDAADQKEQLSKYLATLEEKWLKKAEAIVYLSKDGKKEPSSHAFCEINKAHVEQILVKVAAFADNEHDLVHGWLQPLLKLNSDNDIDHLITDYIDILTEMGEQTMNVETESDFLEWLKIDANYKYAARLAEMYNKKITIVLNQIANKYHELSQRNEYGIVSAAAGFYHGPITVIKVKTGNNNIWIEVAEEKNGNISLTTYGEPGHPPSVTMHDQLKESLALIVSGEDKSSKHFFWPHEEGRLIEAIDGILNFLRSDGAKSMISSVVDMPA